MSIHFIIFLEEIIMKAYTFKLYKNRKKEKSLHASLDSACSIWNHCIALHRRYYRRFDKYLSLYTLQKHVTKLKKWKRYRFWNVLGSQAIQDITQRIERSYQQFFRNLKKRKKGDHPSPPHFKKRSKYHSFTLKQCGWDLDQDRHTIRIGDTFFKYFHSRDIEGIIKTITLKQDSLGDFYIFIVTDHVPPEVASPTGKIVGFDFGLKMFLTSFDGTEYSEIESPLFFKQSSKKVKNAHRNFSKKRKGSRNRFKAHKHLSRTYKKISNQRKDFFHKLGRTLSQTYSLIVLEDLNLNGMKKLWGRKVSDLSFGTFVGILEWQCFKNGSKVHFVDRFFPSSKLCSECGCLNDALTLRDRIWTCPDCETTHLRDNNAALNIWRNGFHSLMG